MKNRYIIMNHKNKMDYLKEHDPITYFELTTDPTGSSNSLPIIGVVLVLLLLVILFGLIVFLINCGQWNN